MEFEEHKEIYNTEQMSMHEHSSDTSDPNSNRDNMTGDSLDINQDENIFQKGDPQHLEKELESDVSAGMDNDTSEKIDTKPKNPNAKWYILQAYSGYEGRVEQTIFEKLKIEGLEHLVNEIFIPSEDIIRTKDGKKRKVNQKYFPGYVLIQMELTPQLWHLLMAVNLSLIHI